MAEIPREIEAIQFSILSAEDILHYGPIEIVSSDLQYESSNGQGGLNDAHLGVVNKGEKCKTCRHDSEECPGHFGHIKLAYPMFKQEYTKIILLILNYTCINCYQLLDKKEKLKNLTSELSGKDACEILKKLLPTGVTNPKICSHCFTVQPKIKASSQLSIEYTYSHIKNGEHQKYNANAILPVGIDEKVFTDMQVYPHKDIYARLKGLTNETIKIFGLDPVFARPENMMWTILPVAPPVVRPNTQNDGQQSYDDWTHCYMEIINTNNKLKNFLENGKDAKLLIEELNQTIAAITFNSVKKIIHRQTRKPLTSVRERLDGKDGLFRRNLAAKRVNYGGRSVVSAGPHTRLEYLGVPMKIVKNLTNPIKATPFNIHMLQQAVMNGPYVYPGAVAISSNKNLRNLAIGSRTDIVVQIGDEVHCHMIDGYSGLEFNRQPTLWRPNIMYHIIKVVRDNTFRLNLSVCEQYNADFDGDEMNCHVPQSEATAAEAKYLMSAHKHMISSQTSSVMSGIVQDSLTGIALFTRNSVKFNKIVAAELALWGEKFDAIDLGAKDVWTSRDIMSLVLPKLNLTTYSKVSSLSTYPNEDKKVIIVNGVHKSGIIDKETVGAGSQGSIIHIIWRDYGPKAAADFIMHVQEISAHYLTNHGFSISIGDMRTTKESIVKAKEVVLQEFAKVADILKTIDSGQFVTPVDVTIEEWFEQQVFIMLGSPLTEQAGKHTFLEINNGTNSLAHMINSGSNGLPEHIYQVTACIGQQSIANKRAAPIYGRRTLPFYQRSDMDPISRGYAFHSYLEGFNFIEAFFISQCGREGITSTAINTASAGYLARKMTKMCERIIIGYDYMARAGNEIIQLIYPFDAWYMETQTMEHIRISMEQFEGMYKWDKVPKVQEVAAKNEYALLLSDRKRIHAASRYTRIVDKFAFPMNVRRVIMHAIEQEKTMDRPKMTIDSINYITSEVTSLCEALGHQFTNPNNKEIPLRYKEVSEMSCILIRSALASKRVIEEYALSKYSLKHIKNELIRQFGVAIIAPKEMVGYIGAQSISEIATQVTIDAFHNVGMSKTGKKDRYQTFSRLLEILNYRREISHPLMNIPLTDAAKYNKSEAIKLKNKIEYLSLRSFLKKSEIIYDPNPREPIVYDKKMVENYFNYTPGEIHRVPGNVSPFMIRFTLNNQKIYHKQIDMITFKLRLEAFTNLCYAIVSDINDDDLIIRVHINLDNLKDYSPEYELKHVEKIMDFLIHDLYIRGIKGLININIVENTIEEENENGELETKTEYMLETEGNNISGITSIMEESIDKTRIETNDIAMIYKKYGIEAARKSMIREAIEILRATKSKMSYMHVRMLIDNMTYGGFIMPLNRHGFKRRNPGPLIRIGFEQNTLQITRAALNSELDKIKHSPTGAIIFGQSLPCGTGSMVDIHVDESSIGINSDDLNDVF